jgi:hypothetical protein
MANPLPSQVHIDRTLTNLAIAMFQDRSGFIWDKIAPIVPVDKKSDKYWVFDNEYFLRDDMQLRPPGTESAGTQYTVSTDTYTADVYALHYDLDNQTNSNSDYDQESKIVRLLTDQMHNHLDRKVISELIGGSIWTTDQTGVSGTPSTNQFKQWNDSASTPVLDIRKQNDLIKQRTGRRANVLVLGAEVWTQLAQNASLLDQFKYSGVQMLDEAMLARAFGVERVVIADAIKTTNQPGQTKATSFNLGKVAALLSVESNPSMESASAAYIFNWTGLNNSGFSAGGPVIRQIDAPLIDATRFEIQIAYDIKKTSALLGVYFASAVA